MCCFLFSVTISKYNSILIYYYLSNFNKNTINCHNKPVWGVGLQCPCSNQIIFFIQFTRVHGAQIKADLHIHAHAWKWFEQFILICLSYDWENMRVFWSIYIVHIRYDFKFLMIFFILIIVSLFWTILFHFVVQLFYLSFTRVIIAFYLSVYVVWFLVCSDNRW